MVSAIGGSSYLSAAMMQISQQLFKAIDSDGDGSTTKTQLQTLSGDTNEVVDTFLSKVDANADDAVSAEEYNAALSQLFLEMKSAMQDESTPPPPPPPDSGEMISALDTDGDGSLSAEEMTAGGVPDAENIFSEIDTDGDGLASAEELDAFAETMKPGGSQGMAPPPPPPPPPGSGSEDMFATLDKDGDGSLTIEEMTEGGIPDAENLFSEIDAGGDGQVSRAESDAFEEKMQSGELESAAIDDGAADINTLQLQMLNQIIARISQYDGYNASNAAGTSILA